MSLSDQERARFPQYARYFDVASEGDCQAIGEFIEWLQHTPYSITERKRMVDTDVYIFGPKAGEPYEYEVERDVMVVRSVEEWLCEFYGIDYRQAMKEKDEHLRELLGTLREVAS